MSWHELIEHWGAAAMTSLGYFVTLTLTRSLEESARAHLEGGEEGDDVPPWRSLIRSRRGWARVGRKYGAEWKMVWKDVTVGFTVAGVIAAFVPPSFFEALFVGSSGDSGPLDVLAQAAIGPVVAFATFIGSMGNIPLAGLLFTSGVSFAGVMAFIFSDLVVFPVIRMNAKFYGWKTALYIAAVFLACIVATALILHYGFELAGILPEHAGGAGGAPEPGERFGVDYTLFFNVFFVAITAVLAWLAFSTGPEDEDEGEDGGHDHGGDDWIERVLRYLAITSHVWLAGGVIAYAVTHG